MSEHPILFSGPMVRAILDGRKTQTRRLVRPQPYGPPGDDVDAVVCKDGTAIMGALAKSGFGDKWRCPFGAPGDMLWVRETWAMVWKSIDPETGRPDDWGGRGGPVPQGLRHGDDLVYAADGYNRRREDRGWKWRPSIFMPRWASRLTLTIESVRVERVQAISEADILAEGVTREAVEELLAAHPERRPLSIGTLPFDWWRAGWIALHGQESWDADPFVWVLGFRRTDVRAP